MKKLIQIIIAMLAISHFLHAEDTVKVVWEKKDNYYLGPQFTPDNKYIVASSDDYKSFCLRMIENGEIYKKVLPYRDGINIGSGCVSNNNKFIIAYAETKIVIYDRMTFDTIISLLINFDELHYGISVRFSKDSKYLIIGAADAGVLIYETTTWQLIKQITKYPYYPKENEKPHVDRAEFFPDGKRIAFSSQFTFIFDLEKDSIIKQLDGLYPRISNDGKYIATSYIDKSIMLYDANTFVKVKDIEMSNTSFSYNFSNNGKYLVINSSDAEE